MWPVRVRRSIIIIISATVKWGKLVWTLESGSDLHSEHRFPAPSSKEGCRKPVFGVWLRPSCFPQPMQHNIGVRSKLVRPPLSWAVLTGLLVRNPLSMGIERRERRSRVPGHSVGHRRKNSFSMSDIKSVCVFKQQQQSQDWVFILIRSPRGQFGKSYPRFFIFFQF